MWAGGLTNRELLARKSSFAEWAAKACVAKYSKEFVNLASVRTEPLDPPTRDLGTFMGFERSRGGLEIVLWAQARSHVALGISRGWNIGAAVLLRPCG
jgi:hypothetical protein